MRTNAQTDEPRACLPPLTAPSKPHFIPPPLACDSHMHLFGDPAKYKFDPDRSYTPPSATVRDIDRLHGHLGIARCVIVQASVYGMNHGVMLEAMRAQPSRFRGVAVLRADTPDSLIDELHEAGVRGFRVNLFQRHGRKIYRGGAGLRMPKLWRLGSAAGVGTSKPGSTLKICRIWRRLCLRSVSTWWWIIWAASPPIAALIAEVSRIFVICWPLASFGASFQARIASRALVRHSTMPFLTGEP